MKTQYDVRSLLAKSEGYRVSHRLLHVHIPPDTLVQAHDSSLVLLAFKKAYISALQIVHEGRASKVPSIKPPRPKWLGNLLVMHKVFGNMLVQKEVRSFKHIRSTCCSKKGLWTLKSTLEWICLEIWNSINQSFDCAYVSFSKLYHGLDRRVCSDISQNVLGNNR